MKKNIKETVDEIFSLYDEFGEADYIGEPVSQIEHMSQAAALAIAEGFEDEVVLAAFFHDIGHICDMHRSRHSMGGYGTVSHEKIGADFLRERGLPENVARLVENHVQAKRYLTFKYPEYYSALSDASRKTLEYQGGVMNQDEAIHFENDPLFEVSIRMRKWDELAKEKNVPLLDMGLLRQKCLDLLKKAESKGA